MIGSDASLRAPWPPLGAEHPHPRAYGTFARFLRAVLDGNSVPLGEAIRKMTHLPATHFRLRDRGTLKPGAFADITALDPATFRDLATYDNPHQFCDGLSAVWVNGALTWHHASPATARAGRYLPLTPA